VSITVAPDGNTGSMEAPHVVVAYEAGAGGVALPPPDPRSSYPEREPGRARDSGRFYASGLITS
jgi:hypothetical protein